MGPDDTEDTVGQIRQGASKVLRASPIGKALPRFQGEKRPPGYPPKAITAAPVPTNAERVGAKRSPLYDPAMWGYKPPGGIKLEPKRLNLKRGVKR